MIDPATPLSGRDPLTGLPDRAEGLKTISSLLGRVRSTGRGFSVVFLDLDNFKTVNDLLGHPAGDEVLTQVADRLRHCVRAEDLVARFGGDEFLVVVPSDHGELVMDIARRTCGVLGAPYTWNGTVTPRTGASAGVVIVDDPGLSVEEIVARADSAMYRAKRGTNDVAEWTPGMAERDERRQQLSSQLLAAMTRDELQVRYQPELDMTTSRVIGCEAQLHWNHPVWGPLAMRDVLGAVREVELLQALTTHLVSVHADLITDWARAGLSLRVDVDASVLLDPQLGRWLMDFSQRTAIAPGLIRLEVDELALDSLGGDPTEALNLCRMLRIPVDLDRFGLGSASLRRMSSRLFDGVKLAPTVTSEAQNDPSSCALIKGTLAAAQHLAISVVATGVDSDSHRDTLLDLGVRRGQGASLTPSVGPDGLRELLVAGGHPARLV